MRRVPALRVVAALGAAGLLLATGASSASNAASARAVAVGGVQTCGLAASGAVQCWGLNRHGELGNGTTVNRSAPVDVRGLSRDVVGLAAGGGGDSGHTCALTRSGTLLCWGANDYGQLGDGTRTERRAPVPVRAFSGVTAVSAGGESFGPGFTCALARGAAWCWGANASGQLGDGTRHFRTRPARVHGLGSGLRAIATGGRHACALTRTRTVRCWGKNQYGQLGDGTHRTRIMPVAVRGLRGVRGLAAEGESTCALTASRGVKCWGYNAEGELGDGSTTDRTRPVDVAGLSHGVHALTGGDAHGCALTGGGAVRCWGFNSQGQLGTGTRLQRHRPVAVPGLGGGVSQVDAGGDDTCAIVRSGAVKCWGDNHYGQIGNGIRGPALRPSQVLGFGRGPCVVPGVRGLPLAAAERAIRARGCRPGLVEETVSRVPKGDVVSQTPGAGTRLYHGGEVHLVVSSGTTPPPGSRLSLPRGAVVDGLSADGHRVAVHVVRIRPKRCHEFWVWRGAGTPAAIHAACSGDYSRPVSDFALGGTRVAWGAYDYGNHVYCYVLTATVAQPRPRDTGFCGGESGTLVGHFAGGGGLLVFNAWGGGTSLYRLSGTRARLIRSVSGKTTSVGADRVAERERDGAIAVYRASGAVIHRFRVHARTAALDGSTLAVATKTTLRPYTLSGRAGRSRPLVGGKHARLVGAAGGIAAYTSGPSVHLLRLADGKDVTVRVTQHGRPFAQITPAGLFAASRTRVTFLPARAIRALFRS